MLPTSAGERDLAETAGRARSQRGPHRERLGLLVRRALPCSGNLCHLIARGGQAIPQPVAVAHPSHLVQAETGRLLRPMGGGRLARMPPRYRQDGSWTVSGRTRGGWLPRCWHEVERQRLRQPRRGPKDWPIMTAHHH